MARYLLHLHGLSALQKLHERSAATPSATAETSERGRPRAKAALPAATRSDPATAISAAPSWQGLDDEPQPKKQRPASQVVLCKLVNGPSLGNMMGLCHVSLHIYGRGALLCGHEMA